MAFRKYTKALAGQAVSIGDAGDSGEPLAAPIQPLAVLDNFDGADDPEAAAELQREKKEVYDKVVADRMGKVRFHALPHLPKGPLGSFLANPELNKLLANCPFHATTTLGPKDKAKSKAFILSADLFPGCMRGGAQDYRLPGKFFSNMEVPDALKSLWSWVLSSRKPNDSNIVFDGRFPQVRRYFDTELGKLEQPSFVFDMWVIYKTPEDDVRYPKRQLAFSNPNRETILVYHPVAKNKKACNARFAFNACGEKSSFDLTYSGVRLRTLGELPKLTTADKKAMINTIKTMALLIHDFW